MRLQPNIGSDRSWVWKVPADYAEEAPTAETLAIRFANAESEFYSLPSIVILILCSLDAQSFKDAFEEAQKTNASFTSKPAPAPVTSEATETKEGETKEGADKETTEETTEKETPEGEEEEKEDKEDKEE